MTVTLELPPHVEQAYLAEAKARGVALADVLREVLMAAGPSAAATELSPDQWVREFKEWTRSHAADDLPLLSDEDISRDSIYGDRGL